MERESSLLGRVVFRVAEVFCNQIAAMLLSIMVLLIIVDVVLRYFWGKGIPGSYELTEFMFGLIVFFGLAYTQAKGRHITVDLVFSRLSKKVQMIFCTITYPIILLLLALICWQTFLRALTSWSRHEVSGVLKIPVAVFIFGAGIGIFVFLISVLVDLIQNLKRLRA